MAYDLHAALQLLVPLRQMQIQQQGGAFPQDFTRIVPYAAELATRGDLLLHGDRSELLDKIVDAIAVMSFLPGGITAFGQHWQRS